LLNLEVSDRLAKYSTETWLVTGVAGFIGSHIATTLLSHGLKVRGVDDFSTGSRANVSRLMETGSESFTFIEGTIADGPTCARALEGVSRVLHQAAIGSVPRSIEDPLRTHQANVTGFLTLLDECRKVSIRRFVYASSSSVYGDSPELPKREATIGAPLSPYAASKRCGEVYASAFQRAYGMECVGLRYFNVFGPGQNPDGPYAAVVPRWIQNVILGRTCRVFGDGDTSRDFCFVENVVQANILAATADATVAHDVYNIAVGDRTTLNRLHEIILAALSELRPETPAHPLVYEPFRQGDVRHSHADIGKAASLLGYIPSVRVEEGIRRTIESYLEDVLIST
jgi:UDP-N-acetylglucosamine 4-epimerase